MILTQDIYLGNKYTTPLQLASDAWDTRITKLIIDKNPLISFDKNDQIPWFDISLCEYICKSDPIAWNIIFSLKSEQVKEENVIKQLQVLIQNGHSPIIQAVISCGGFKLTTVINNHSNSKQLFAFLRKLPIKFLIKTGKFILTSTTYQDESKYKKNTPFVKEDSETFVENKKLYWRNQQKLVLDEKYFFVVSKKGKLHLHLYKERTSDDLDNFYHSFFLKGKEGTELFGYGREVAGAGVLKIKNGQIKEMNDHSGHYQPLKEQHFLVKEYFKTFGILSDDFELRTWDGNLIGDEDVNLTGVSYCDQP